MDTQTPEQRAKDYLLLYGIGRKNKCFLDDATYHTFNRKHARTPREYQNDRRAFRVIVKNLRKEGMGIVVANNCIYVATKPEELDGMIRRLENHVADEAETMRELKKTRARMVTDNATKEMEAVNG